MSLSSKNLSSIQKAGQAAHDASEAIAATVRTQAEGMVANLASQPFSVESDQGIARFKTLSKLSQGLAAVESQLQELYAVAADLASPASDVIILKAISKRKAIANTAAVDVVAKPTKAAKKTMKAGRKAATLTANDNKLLSFLQGVLKANDVTVLTGHAMADGSGMPLGSVGLALKKLISVGAVKQVGRGTYKLGTAAAGRVVKAAPAKKTKTAGAKKIKAAKADVPAAKELKGKSAKAAKAAPAKKAKGPAAKKVKAVSEPAPIAPMVEAPTVEAEAAPV